MTESINPFDWHPIAQTPKIAPPDGAYSRLEFKLEDPTYDRRQQFVDFVRENRMGLGSGATFSGDYSIVDVEIKVFEGILRVVCSEVFERYGENVVCRFR